MLVPGSNLLGMALRVIARQSFDYYAFIARVKNSAGLFVPDYASPVTLTGSVQPVPRVLYQNLGLDLQRNYLTFYVEKDILDLRRDVSGDKFVFAGLTYQCESITNWFPMDGWVPVLAVQIVGDNEG